MARVYEAGPWDDLQVVYPTIAEFLDDYVEQVLRLGTDQTPELSRQRKKLATAILNRRSVG